MGCQFSAVCKVVEQPVGNHLFPVNAVRRLRRRFRRNSATPAQRRSRSVPLCDKNGPFVTSARDGQGDRFRAPPRARGTEPAGNRAARDPASPWQAEAHTAGHITPTVCAGCPRNYAAASIYDNVLYLIHETG